ncbi:FHA domain-containing protein [Candidatus Woesearchaeota archaeon]|jgi:hypothetical protein|nr:FHA domain-containing protein [Candidatus Woesearchaeota archaeon]
MIRPVKLIRTHSGDALVIDRITHLGRFAEVKDAKARTTPQEIHDAQIAIQILEARVSRNHAIIYPPTEDETGFLLDLNSHNGTFLNNCRLPVGIKTKLNEGDILKFPGSNAFEYRPLDYVPQSPVFTQCLESGVAPARNYGLMVGHPGFNLNGVVNDVKKLKKMFEQRGFNGNIQDLLKNDATVEGVFANLDKFRGLVTNDAIFMFYFSGHGDYEGNLCLGGPVGLSEKLNPKKLLELLSDFRGQKLLILDGCYTSEFAKYDLPARTVLIGSEGKAYEGPAQSMVGPSSEGVVAGELNVMGYCSRAIYKALKAHPNSMSVDELVAIVREDDRIKFRQQAVTYHPMTQILLQSAALHEV